MRLEWQPRDEPLAALAAFGMGVGLAPLQQAWERMDPVRRSRLRRVEHQRGLLLIAEAGIDLPWSQDIRYAGVDPAAPRLLLPTWLAPSLPLDLLERACAQRVSGSRWLLWAEPALLWGLL